MENTPYIVYVRIDQAGYITAVNSSEFLRDLTGWVKIDEGYGDKYHHAQGNYFPQQIMTESGAYCYKLINGNVVECTADEVAKQEAANTPKHFANRNVVAGEYITVSGVLYNAINNIPNGGEIIVGQNAVVTTVEEQLYELTKGA